MAFVDPQAFPTTRVCLVRPGHNPGTLPAALSLPAAVQPCLEVSLFAGGLLGGFPRPGRSGRSHCGESLQVVAVFGPAQACGRQTPEAAVPLPAEWPRAPATLLQIDQPLLITWHFNSRTMDICISFLSVVMTFKILLYMLSIIAMCWSRGGFKAFTYNTTESGEWEQELGKVVIMA